MKTGSLPPLRFGVPKSLKTRRSLSRSLPLSPSATAEPVALYLHFPFCAKICPFCSFSVRKEDRRLHRLYVDDLKRELELKIEARFDLASQIPVSVYFGGGTPSLLSVEYYAELMDWLRQAGLTEGRPQISFELNPEDVSEAYVGALSELGINRFSVGIQSFFDGHLRFLGRNHREASCLRCVSVVAKFPDVLWNFDLIYGFPGLGAEALEKNLALVFEAGAGHVGFYGLTVEEGTPFARNRKLKRWLNENENRIAEQLRSACEAFAEEGFEHYELSNFAKRGQRSVQNEIYWNFHSYFGFGLGAHSFEGGKRYANADSLGDWRNELRKGRLPFVAEETATRKRELEETLIVGFRTRKGVDALRLKNMVGETNARALTNFCKDRFGGKWLNFSPNGFFPTTEGMLMADELFLQTSAFLDSPHFSSLSSTPC